MAVASNAIHIEGLRELQAALRKMDGQSQKQLRLVFNEAATIVKDTAEPRVARRSGRAAGTLKARSGQREAVVQGGGGAAPYYAWLDFGGRVGRRNSVVRARVGKDGRYIFPSYRDRRAKVQVTISEGLESLIRRSGLEPS